MPIKRLRYLKLWFLKNRADIYHVATPVLLALLISPTSLAGASVFLFTWGIIRASQGFG